AVERELGEVKTAAARAEQRRNEVDREARTSREQLETVRAQLAEREREEHESTAELERARHALAAAREHEAALLVERRSAEEPLASLSARREALEELERQRVGLAPAARQLLEARDRFDGILGPLSDYVRVSHGGAETVERLLGDWLNAVLVRDEETIQRIQQWHRESQPGPLVLLPVTPGPTTGHDAASPVAGGVSFLAPAEPWLRTLLRGDQVIDGGAIRRANGAVF